MGVLFDYFRAPDDDRVRRQMDENEAFSPVPGTFDGIELKTIDPVVILGQLIAHVSGQEWRPGLVGERLIWPEDGEQDLAHEGPWVTVLGDQARDVLAGIPADRVPELARWWATVEEFDGFADEGFLREVVADFTALAARARADNESLYCWMSL